MELGQMETGGIDRRYSDGRGTPLPPYPHPLPRLKPHAKVGLCFWTPSLRQDDSRVIECAQMKAPAWPFIDGQYEVAN